MKRPFYKIGIIGVLTILVALSLLFVYPGKTVSLPSGFSSPALAFKFAKTTEDVYTIFGKKDSKIRQELAKKMDRGNKADIIVMLIYSLFLFVFIIKCSEIKKQRIFVNIALLVPIVLLGNIIENIQLLKITAKLAKGDISVNLFVLQIFAWLKWGALSVLYAAMAYYYFSRGELFSKIIAVVGILVLFLTIISFLFQCVINEILVWSHFLLVILITVYTFISKKKYFFG